jgi:hypothetical protein
MLRACEVAKITFFCIEEFSAGYPIEYPVSVTGGNIQLYKDISMRRAEKSS